LVREYRRVFESQVDDGLQPLKAFANQMHSGISGEVAWLDWTEDSFLLARELDLPILLNISAVWCRWCRLMDETTYGNSEVASLINGEFIPIRVDNDRRPDINARYNMGGWPTTTILTPSGETLTGRTYVTPDQMVRFLQQASEYYKINRDRLVGRLEQVELERSQLSHKTEAAGPVSLAIVDDLVGEVVASFDRVYGGFGDAPKLPNPDALELALAVQHRTSDAQLRRLVELTLTNMATGGIHDQEMGGFFRYSTTKDWSIPQFEKLLKDNAKLLRVYLQAYQAFGRDLYEQTARRIVEFINSTLYDQTRGIFYSSQAADDRYYDLSLEERQNVEPPYIDQTAYTNWNAMTVVALLEASAVLSEPALARQATHVLDFLWRNLYEPGMGMFHCYDDAARVPGLLTDQAWTARALLHAYQYTAQAEYLDRAQELVKECVYMLYADPAGLGYFDCVVDINASGRLKEGLKNINENALMAEVSTILFRLTGEDIYRDGAEAALSAFGAGYRTYGYFAARYGLSVERALRPYVAMIIAGNRSDSRTERLLQAGLKIYVPNRVVQIFDPVWERDRLEAMGFLRWKYPLFTSVEDNFARSR
jgi:uncharacterized protein YyaL (SSP411 family)